MKSTLLALLLLHTSTLLFAQPPGKKEKVLLNLQNEPVLTEEFIYLFDKNHKAKPEEYKEPNINEYLTLFTRFKLKVKEARNRGYDTTNKFKTELAGYQEALRKPYLPDNNLADSLARIAYTRMQTEIKASHILIRLPENPTIADTITAWDKIKNIEAKLKSGEDFATLALNYSEDPSAKSNEGNLGYFTAFQMVYPFETGAYQTNVGEVSKIVRTRFGYHLIKVWDKRPAQGEVEVSHIMVRHGNERTSDQAKTIAFEIYDRLEGGMPWNELCRTYSEDANSKDNGGKLRPFGTGAFASVPEFETAAFSLNQPGTYTAPFTTAFGWHIVKLERKIPIAQYDELAPQLKNKVSRDERMQAAKRNVQLSLQKRFRFTEIQKTKESVFALADTTLQKAKWNPNYASLATQDIFTLANKAVKAKDFFAYVKNNQKPNKQTPQNYLQQLYDAFVQQQLEACVENELLETNTEYRYLSKEYYEGILLFEIMEKEVWAKAASDTVGLKQYYQQHKENYTGSERAVVEVYTAPNKTNLNEIATQITNGLEVNAEVLKKNNAKKEEGKFQKTERAYLQQIPWQKGLHTLALDGNHYLVRLLDVLPAGILPLDEVRGKVIGDYQNELENLWVKELESKYPVKINAKAKKYVLANLVRK
ncbi:MAG: peptidylprolyl isomerase [Cyclobacteriaceae bacterium]|nr:peptidylprolyl isomerase [Cyclobacteriaceae bacterium]